MSRRQNKSSSCIYSDMFGDDCVNFRDRKNLSVTVDGVTVFINPQTRVSLGSCFCAIFDRTTNHWHDLWPLTSSCRRWRVQMTSLWGRWLRSLSYASMRPSAPPVMSAARSEVISDVDGGFLGSKGICRTWHLQIVFYLKFFINKISRK